MHRTAAPTSCRSRTHVFFNDTATTEIYTLSLHDALPIFAAGLGGQPAHRLVVEADVEDGLHHPGHRGGGAGAHGDQQDRKSTRLNSSHANISYAVFCLKKQTHRPARRSSRPRTPAPDREG